MFKGCNLKKIFGPKVVEVLGEWEEGGFENCKELIEVNLPSVLRVGNSAFRGCSAITHVNL
jgi:hypothetical protein